MSCYDSRCAILFTPYAGKCNRRTQRRPRTAQTITVHRQPSTLMYTTHQYNSRHNPDILTQTPHHTNSTAAKRQTIANPRAWALYGPIHASANRNDAAKMSAQTHKSASMQTCRHACRGSCRGIYRKFSAQQLLPAPDDRTVVKSVHPQHRHTRENAARIRSTGHR